MNLKKCYFSISSKYPDYVTQKQLSEICGICLKTAHTREHSGKIPYQIIYDGSIRQHAIRLTDILSYLYTEGLREPDHLSADALRTFYEKEFSYLPDLLLPQDICEITGFSDNTVWRWIGSGKLKVLHSGRKFEFNLIHLKFPFFLNFLISPSFRNIRQKTEIQKALMKKFIESSM